jgi:hypothetical protein
MRALAFGLQDGANCAIIHRELYGAATEPCGTMDYE